MLPHVHIVAGRINAPAPPLLTALSNLDAPRAGGVYASADAARVGGGLYLAVVEALCTLATDPAPRVS